MAKKSRDPQSSHGKRRRAAETPEPRTVVTGEPRTVEDAVKYVIRTHKKVLKELEHH